RARHDAGGRPPLAAPPDRHPAAARAGARGHRARGAQPHPRGAVVEPRRPGALPPVRLRSRRSAEELLRRDQRGRARDVGARGPASRVRRPPRRDRASGRGRDRGGAPPALVVVRILGIETSCDETAAAVVEDGRRVRSSVVSSQVELHAPYGGVVPELASRAHVELVNPVVDEALMEAGVLDAGELDAIAACHGPGLAGALLVGVSAAKALALTTGLPDVQVNHLEAHLYAGWLDEPDLEPPLAVLIVSGGHTLLVVMEDHGRYRMMGQTVDDAAGEAFDKVARFLGLGYPGGPAIDRLAADGEAGAVAFPRAMRDEGYDFSFSG